MIEIIKEKATAEQLGQHGMLAMEALGTGDPRPLVDIAAGLLFALKAYGESTSRGFTLAETSEVNGRRIEIQVTLSPALRLVEEQEVEQE